MKKLMSVVALIGATLLGACTHTPEMAPAQTRAMQENHVARDRHTTVHSAAGANQAARFDEQGCRNAAAERAFADGASKSPGEAIVTGMWYRYTRPSDPGCTGLVDAQGGAVGIPAPVRVGPVSGLCPLPNELSGMTMKEVCAVPITRACVARARATVIAGNEPTVAQVAEVDREMCAPQVIYRQGSRDRDRDDYRGSGGGGFDGPRKQALWRELKYDSRGQPQPLNTNTRTWR